MDETTSANALRVVVVGPCASGKTTLVAALTEAGYDAYGCAQEHSEISDLWNHLHPDAVIALDVDLATIRGRRGEDWPETIYLEQQRRLTAARVAARTVIDTAVNSPEETLRLAIGALETGGDLRSDASWS